MQSKWKLWAAAALSAVLLELPFPLAGPMPPWRSIFAWFGLVPLLWALLKLAQADQPRPLRRAFFLAYFCGVLWYVGNCYWIRDTMGRYGDMPPLAPELLTLAFSLVLGAYFGLFGLGLVLVQRATNSTRLALAFAPFLWTGLDLAAARITSVPWDQLGYSQVDNALAVNLAPWTGVYGITFLIVAMNALYFAAFRQTIVNASMARAGKPNSGAHTMLPTLLVVVGIALTIFFDHPSPPKPAPTAAAVLIHPNLDVGDASNWPGPEWDRHMADFARLADECASGNETYIAGIPQTGAPTRRFVCPPNPTHPDLVAWPESPAPYFEGDPRFQKSLASLAASTDAPLVIGGIGMDFMRDEHAWREYNSAIVFGADGQRVGRYDKIHLVPFGEYIPFQNLLTFAHKLTGRVGTFDRGSDRNVFLLPTQNGGPHRYGVFICYEAVFADEVRQFAKHGAEAFVNISDDGWYGDTSAPWQHLNMARMRAIENRRWLLRDTNNGVTAAIDPYGRVRQSIPRHEAGALPAEFGFRNDITFYTAHGDVFAWLCAIVALGVLGWAAGRPTRGQMRLAKNNQVG